MLYPSIISICYMDYKPFQGSLGPEGCEPNSWKSQDWPEGIVARAARAGSWRLPEFEAKVNPPSVDGCRPVEPVPSQLCYIISYTMLYGSIVHDIVLYYIILYYIYIYIILYYIILYYIILHYIIFYYIILHYIILYYITL